MRDVVLIANPSASGFTGARFRAVTAALAGQFRITTAWPDSPEAAREEARAAARAGAYAVLAMGGDGVAHHVANGLIHSGTALGILPAGTTNVVARILRIPAKPEHAALAVAEMRPRPLTVAHVTTESVAAPRSEYAIFALGVGYDADVVEKAERRPQSKYSFGSLHYAQSAAGQILANYRNRLANLRIECNGSRVDAVAVMVQVHHVYTYFGRLGLYLGPGVQDGLVACAIERVTVTKAAGMLRHAAIGRSLGDAAGCHLFRRFEKLIIEADPPTRFQADGELLGAASSLEITPAHNALRVLAPPARS